MQTNNKMAVVPVGKLIWQMSIPPLISMFLQYSYNLIDSAFVARLSENALTAVSLSFPITTLMNAASIWLGVSVNVLIAGYLGQKKQDEANATVTHGLLLAFGIGALLNLMSLLIMKPYFRAFTNNEESDRRIGIRHQKQIDKGHHKRTEGVHDKRWQAKGKNTVDHLLFQMKAFDFYLHFLLFAQQ